ncbi:MAG: PrsW family intramembrane metalloprotease [Anaerolineales bacterium]|nr:PrsW family intramembrane metalloprotease [Anaerolineales bacterium]
MQIPALVIATIIPLIFLYIIYTLDLYKTGNFRYVIVCFVSGAVAYFAAAQANRAICMAAFPFCGDPTPYGIMASNDVARYVAPVTEEILKALILIYLVRKPNFTYFVDGAIYGFAVGIGFAVFENYEYVLTHVGSGLGIAIGRVLSANLMHATTSAMVGVGLGIARFRRSLWPIFLLVSSLLLGMVIHSMFNHLSTDMYMAEGLRLIFSALLGFAGAGLVAFIIQRGLAEEKGWIEEKLGAADRVTGQEASIVHRLTDLQEILAPLAQKFGSEKADQIENFLVIQARLGILRKTLDKLNDEKMRTAVEKQMNDLRTQMDEARRLVGSYCMLYLRNIFPPESSPLWGLLETRIQEKIATRSSSGLNAFAKLSQRVAKSDDADEVKN